ncbi:stage V sporulation protein AD [Lachnotalea glycerini]|jgi:stage V sporulation protein AD|uniref:Stage V sporulation protein AD n=1 Tax=Lachnotalea glycerini TaxID=1763509 RepID=A0A255IMJ3_9FIRM|nr:stage V sporulation protein AD [Lachnotalea glycerini]PXV85986.1 stage V sporulation protein AD [Lachnotalea glycerini]RDY31418.1 stage V sporulation protein AD [Lachnotalea glycerini]
MSNILGKQSLKFEVPPYIIGTANIVGKKEGEGPLGKLFDVVGEDDLFGEETWEEAESSMQNKAASWAIDNAKLTKDQIRYIFAGDLLGQTIATSFGLLNFNVPLFGLYGACSTAGESLSLAAMTVAAGYAENVLAVTSSHFASAEKQFRYPLEYGNQRPLAASWTVTGSGAFIVSSKQGKIKISGITTGKIIDYGIKDSMNMGAAMAPAACDTIYQNLMDFSFQPEDYDKIVTGDLGYIGSDILIDLLKEKGFDISIQHMDCGKKIFDQKTQDTHAGGSGCGCSAATLSAYLLKEIEMGNLKRILFVPTGALLSTVSFNEGQSVPGIAHGVIIERCE